MTDGEQMDDQTLAYVPISDSGRNLRPSSWPSFLKLCLPYFSFLSAANAAKDILNKSSYKSTVTFEKRYTFVDLAILVLMCKQQDFCVLICYMGGR